MPTRPRILILSSSLLTDRMLLWSDCVGHLAERSEVEIWAASCGADARRDPWSDLEARVRTFPEVGPFRERFNLLRRVNEAVWDARLRPPSRLSMERHRHQPPGIPVSLARGLGRALALLPVERQFERLLEAILLRQRRSHQTAERLAELRPDLLVTMAPFWFHEPGVVIEAKRLGIPTVALIPSWDNISTKKRLVLRYDGYLVWSDLARRQLHHFYPQSLHVPVEVVGVPQYDVFFDDALGSRREEFLDSYGLDPRRPTILYAIGSPNFIAGEVTGAVDLAETICRGELGDVQMIVRPHPVHAREPIDEQFAPYAPRVVVQTPSAGGDTPFERRQEGEHIRQWIDTFRHVDVVINLASTVALDAAFADRPVIDIAYDPHPRRRDQALIEEITSEWTHLRPMFESGGVWVVRDVAELHHAILTYLEHPELHRAERRAMLETICGHTDGRSGRRFGQAVEGLAAALGGRTDRRAGAEVSSLADEALERVDSKT